MHLKNYSVITDRDVGTLAPCYDFLNLTVVLRKSSEESALPLRGKKSGFTRNLVVKYLGAERLGLPEQVIEGVLRTFRDIGPLGQGWIERSFLSPGLK